MQIQKSFSQTEKGILYLVPTPIGNLEDMTFRAIRMMKEANVIAAEDTRNTKKLCNYFEISTPLISYHEHNKDSSGKELIRRLEVGETVALVSDAGMPCISDPGFELAAEAIRAGITVVPLPGANAALTALISSGIKTQPFYFYGFLSRGKKEKKLELEGLKKQNGAIIFYEAPHRLKETLRLMQDILGNRNIVLCRELTKKFEEFIRGTVEEAIQWADEEEVRGEFCLILEGSGETNDQDGESEWWASMDIKEHVQHYIAEKNLPSKEAIKETSKDRNLPKREVYQAYHVD
ncbi:16S rRNA (cytidine(1402)-2'-O)-methyltransferase [Lederbergia wuyishanensis]|uniref:Ribosomal RNA small subunit methyltransferase I n=1 Tax=Lederbergia wuyishanensis TaxID=1347903 RepID=A0ABU0DAR5_9BACI|nr:16S rRNA (cytidine(1402)-2'-O)-methyltransferase [Lederbergia wuyishanensis]MCJ8009998.1 16S rRNA (cytidine(1402)-2'-O)-methyltransferase [Lederbergia wuyishanensis]MDQ0345511.1 16S rRNA (cytidine1402-2'-O)-methyltransferase [Lederbergia wuyishanensis]